MDYIHSIEDLDAFVNEEMLSIVYVSRPGCSVCHGLLPQVEDLLADYPKIKARQ